MSTATAISILLSTLGFVVCAGLAAHKNRSALGYGILGFFFPLIGIIVTALVSKREPTEERDDRLRAEGMDMQLQAMRAWQEAPTRRTTEEAPSPQSAF